MEVLYWQSRWTTFQSWKGDRNTITNYDRNRKLHNIQRREFISSLCKTLRVLSAHRNVTQYSPVLQRFSAKTNECWSLWISATRGTKQTEWPPQLSTHIFPRTDLRNEDQRSFFGKFPFRRSDCFLVALTTCIFVWSTKDAISSHTTVYGQRLFHWTQPSYRIIQVNEFVCWVRKKNLFDGLIDPIIHHTAQNSTE